MGAYLNKPVVEKEREEGSGNGLKYACTSMQGWRANQEDAHNCVVDIHNEWNLFAVYDGHGGSEVSKFTSAKFPDFLKERKFWEHADVNECLQSAFVEFDEFLRSEGALKELATLSGNKKKGSDDDDDSEDEADRIGTIEESAIPIQELIQRYGVNLPAGMGARSLFSAFMKNHEISSDDEDEDEEEADEGEEKEEKDDENGSSEKEQAEKNLKKRCSKSPIQSAAKKAKSEEEKLGAKNEQEEVDENAAGDKKETTEDDKKETISTEGAPKSSNTDPEAKNEEDDNDADFVADEDEAEDEQSDEELEEEDYENIILGGGGETAGEDSGTTACVCLVGKDKVIVANAGDSRAVLCRAGKAVDLSVDHKPEDEIETTRIHNAGGVIEDGRVNGGLNLSRALGDHAYKKNEKLPLKDQMITALPDVKVEPLTPEDEFIVVACDGIWNSMESQEVVDFVRDLLEKGKTCADVCDALCDACLADSTEGDGTGCDNMTVICTQFVR